MDGHVNMCSMKTMIPGSFSPVCRSCRSILHLAMGHQGRRPLPPPPRQHPGAGDWRGRNLWPRWALPTTSRVRVWRGRAVCLRRWCSTAGHKQRTKSASDSNFLSLKTTLELLHHKTDNLFAAVCGKVTHGDVLLRRHALVFTFIFCLHGKRTGLFGRDSVLRGFFSVRPVIVREYHSPFLNNADLARREMRSKHFHHPSVERRLGNVGHFLFWCDVTLVEVGALYVLLEKMFCFFF